RLPRQRRSPLLPYTTLFRSDAIEKIPQLWSKVELYRQRRPELVKLVSRWNERGVNGRRVFSVVRVFRMTRILRRMLDEGEFLSPDRKSTRLNSSHRTISYAV